MLPLSTQQSYTDEEFAGDNWVMISSEEFDSISIKLFFLLRIWEDEAFEDMDDEGDDETKALLVFDTITDNEVGSIFELAAKLVVYWLREEFDDKEKCGDEDDDDDDEQEPLGFW